MVWSCWQTKGWTGGNIISLISLNPLLFKKNSTCWGFYAVCLCLCVGHTGYTLIHHFWNFRCICLCLCIRHPRRPKTWNIFSFQPYPCTWQSFYIFIVFRFCSFWCFCIFAPLSAVWLPVQMTRVELEGEFFLFAFLGFPKLEAALDCNFLEKITGSSFGNKMLFWLLLAPQSGALSRLAFRDIHPIHPIHPIGVSVQNHSMVIWNKPRRQTKSEPGAARYRQGYK